MSQLAADFNAVKQSLGDGRSNHTVALWFHRFESNIKVLQARGWVGCNSILMDHPDVQRNAARIKAAEDR